MATKLFVVRRIELRDEAAGLDAVIVIDHELFPCAAGGTRMLADVDTDEVSRLARAMTWKFAVCGVRYAGAKAGIRFAGGDRAAVLAAYRRALTPFRERFLTGPDMGTQPSDFVTPDLEELPLWAKSHEGLGMDDLATGSGRTWTVWRPGKKQLGVRLFGRSIEWVENDGDRSRLWALHLPLGD